MTKKTSSGGKIDFFSLPIVSSQGGENLSPKRGEIVAGGKLVEQIKPGKSFHIK